MTRGEPVVLEEVTEGIARITLNRPAKRNALDAATVAALTESLLRAETESAVRVVALSGAGKDFCAGADLEELRQSAAEPIVDSVESAEALARLFSTIRKIGKPVVALVTGRALGGGCGLATACDLVLSAESALFGYTEVRLGFVPAIVTAVVRRNLPEKRAFELLATGDLHGARDMERIGLVNRVFPDATFEAEAQVFLRRLAERSSTALGLTKRHLYGQDTASFEAGLAVGVAVNALARTSDDARAGIARFLEERAARKGQD